MYYHKNDSAANKNTVAEKKLIEATFGKIKIKKGEKTVFGTVDGEIVIFD